MVNYSEDDSFISLTLSPAAVFSKLIHMTFVFYWLNASCSTSHFISILWSIRYEIHYYCWY